MIDTTPVAAPPQQTRPADAETLAGGQAERTIRDRWHGPTRSSDPLFSTLRDVGGCLALVVLAVVVSAVVVRLPAAFQPNGSSVQRPAGPGPLDVSPRRAPRTATAVRSQSRSTLRPAHPDELTAVTQLPETSSAAYRPPTTRTRQSSKADRVLKLFTHSLNSLKVQYGPIAALSLPVFIVSESILIYLLFFPGLQAFADYCNSSASRFPVVSVILAAALFATQALRRSL